MQKQFPSIEKMLIKNQANVIVAMENEMDRKLKELELKQRAVKIAPIVLRKTRCNISACSRAFALWHRVASQWSLRKEREVLLDIIVIGRV